VGSHVIRLLWISVILLALDIEDFMVNIGLIGFVIAGVAFFMIGMNWIGEGGWYGWILVLFGLGAAVFGILGLLRRK